MVCSAVLVLWKRFCILLSVLLHVTVLINCCLFLPFPSLPSSPLSLPSSPPPQSSSITVVHPKPSSKKDAHHEVELTKLTELKHVRAWTRTTTTSATCPYCSFLLHVQSTALVCECVLLFSAVPSNSSILNARQ